MKLVILSIVYSLSCLQLCYGQNLDLQVGGYVLNGKILDNTDQLKDTELQYGPKLALGFSHKLGQNSLLYIDAGILYSSIRSNSSTQFRDENGNPRDLGISATVIGYESTIGYGYLIDKELLLSLNVGFTRLNVDNFTDASIDGAEVIFEPFSTNVYALNSRLDIELGAWISLLVEVNLASLNENTFNYLSRVDVGVRFDLWRAE